MADTKDNKGLTFKRELHSETCRCGGCTTEPHFDLVASNGVWTCFPVSLYPGMEGDIERWKCCQRKKAGDHGEE